MLHFPTSSGHEMSIVQLLVALQCAHNTAAEVTGHLAFYRCTLQPDQFSFILKHSVRPLIQLSVPAGLSDPTHLQFEHPVFTEEEYFEEKAINSVLPMPHHPDLEKLPPKDPTHCLAGAVHCVLRCRLFKNNLSQGTTADPFQVERKKFYQAITSRMYNAGKKPTKAMKMQKEQKEGTEKLAKLKEQPANPQKQEKQEAVPPDDENKVLYCDNDDDDSLPDPFASESTVETLDTKEDQNEDKATGTSEVMDTTDMLELISDEEEDEPTKKFTFKKLTGRRSQSYRNKNLFSYLQTSKFIIVYFWTQNSKFQKKIFF